MVLYVVVKMSQFHYLSFVPTKKLNRNFIYLIGDLNEIKTKDYGDNQASSYTDSSSITGESDFLNEQNVRFDKSSLSQVSPMQFGSCQMPVPDDMRQIIFGTPDQQQQQQQLLQQQQQQQQQHHQHHPHVQSAQQLVSSTCQLNIMKEDLLPIAILGIGGFGKVELVVWRHDRTKSFALKCMKKQHIVDTRQEKHIMSERNLMFEIQCPQVCR